MTVYKIERNEVITFLVDFNLINYFKSTVRNQRLRNANALGGLVIFKECCNDAWERKSRTIEGVAEFGLLVGIAIAALEAVCLVAVEVRD